jgi:hypothetical protein
MEAMTRRVLAAATWALAVTGLYGLLDLTAWMTVTGVAGGPVRPDPVPLIIGGTVGLAVGGWGVVWVACRRRAR